MRPNRVVRKKTQRRRAPPAVPPSEGAQPPPSSAPDYELDIAPELVMRGPDERRDRQPVCSLPHDDV